MRIIDIVGARPQFIKLAPILQEINRHNQDYPDQLIEEILVHTGQHYDYEMSQVFFEELGIRNPDYHLNVGSGSHALQTGEMLQRIEEVLLNTEPEIVMVYGDTNTTLAGALAAAKLHISVAHVEAGLRSFNRRMPEEINRLVADHISDLLFCPTETAVKNLCREGILACVHLVGDVMYDAVLQYGELAETKSDILDHLSIKPKQYMLATLHRAENADNPERLEGIFKALIGIAQAGHDLIFPIHPRTRKHLSNRFFNISTAALPDGMQIVEPVSYLDMLMLERHAKLILTDSGGVQKEAFFFRVPCLTLREETEWVETVESGWNVLVGCDPNRILKSAISAKPGLDYIQPYGEGFAATKIINLLKPTIYQKHKHERA